MTVVAVAAGHAANSWAGLLGAERFEDPENARTILLMAGGLLLLAVLVTAGTVWWWRTSKVEHPSLGPLEVMSSRSWWKGDYTARRRRLDAARPATEPEDGQAEPGDAVDLDAMRRGSPPQFDDLVEVSPKASADAADGGNMADLDALLAAAGAAIAEVQVVAAVGESAAVEPEAEPEPEPVTTEPVVPDVVDQAVGADDPTVAVDAGRAPIDPLLRPPRSD